MNTAKSLKNSYGQKPSVFALLIDKIHSMTEAEQQLLWLRLNKNKLTETAKLLDESVTLKDQPGLSTDLIIEEAKKDVRKKKKN